MMELFTAWLSPLTVFAGYLAPIVGPLVTPEKLEPTVWIESLASLFWLCLKEPFGGLI